MRKFHVFLFLSICFVSAQAHARSFLKSVRLDSPQTTLAEVLSELHSFSSKPYSYLSLGESHLESRSAHAIQKIFLNEYIASLNVEKEEVKFCTEEIPNFLQSEAGEWLQRNVGKTSVQLGNSARDTKFSDCPEDGFRRYVTYSGFFHQYRFAKPFLDVFGDSPVMREYDNNIRAQMLGLKGFFISQIEWKAVELFEMNRIMNKRYNDVSELRTELLDLQSISKSLRSKMEPVLQKNSYDDKVGLFLKRKNLKIPTKKALPQNDMYILITEYAHQGSRAVFNLLNRILELPNEVLERIFVKHSYNQAHYSRGLFEQKIDGTQYQTSYGSFLALFAGDSEFLQIAFAEDTSLLLAVAPGQESIRYIYKNAENETEISEERAMELMVRN